MPTSINPKIAYPKANGPIILAQSAIPVILAPNGTIATNGVVTLGTALPTTYSGGAWVRFPAGAVSGGAAGLYWTVFSSTTAGQVTTTFIDPATQFIPYIPTGLTNAVGSNVAYTQTTGADITLANITVPGGLMGPNGGLRSTVNDTRNGTANAKQTKGFLGTGGVNAVNFVSSSAASTLSTADTHVLRNRGVQDRQFVFTPGWAGGGGVATAVSGFYSANTAIDQPFTFTGQIAVATDFIVLEGFTIEVLPS